MPYVDIPSGRCFYRFDGPSGAPLVVLSNSLGTDHTMWDSQIAAMSHHFRVLRYDTRGHGASASPSGPYTIAGLGQDVVDLYRALGVSRASFCGLSMGGMAGMWLATSAPELVDRLILCDTAALMGPPQAWDARIVAIRAGGMSAIADMALARWFSAPFMNANPPVIGAMRRILERIPPEGYIACCAAIRDMDQRALIARISAPTLVIAGSLDTAATPADGHFLADAIPGARYVELEAAHLSNIEAPEAFTEALMRFLMGEIAGE